MLKQMEGLLKNESQSYYENFLGLDHLKERHQYLKKNGFIVYGAVVTGPVKELLKLKKKNKSVLHTLGEGVLELGLKGWWQAPIPIY